MHHAHHKEDFNNYNTFRFFEKTYGGADDGHLDELTMPEHKQSNHFILKLAVFLAVIGTFGLCLPPVLSYALKTPYPIVVISENSMQPALQKNDLIIFKGVIGSKDLDQDDIVVYSSIAGQSGPDAISIGRILAKGDIDVSVKGDSYTSPRHDIAYHQVIGKASTFKLPWVGFFGNIFK